MVSSDMCGVNQRRIGRMKRDVCLGDPRLVEAEKITAIQNTSGSQYLQNRPNTAQKNNGGGPKATAKTSAPTADQDYRSGAGRLLWKDSLKWNNPLESVTV